MTLLLLLRCHRYGPAAPTGKGYGSATAAQARGAGASHSALAGAASTAVPKFSGKADAS